MAGVGVEDVKAGGESAGDHVGGGGPGGSRV